MLFFILEEVPALETLLSKNASPLEESIKKNREYLYQNREYLYQRRYM